MSVCALLLVGVGFKLRKGKE